MIVNSGSGDAMNALNDFVGAAKMWTQPGNAITQIKNIALGHSTANVAEMAGLATVPLALVLIIPQIFSKRRRR